MDDDVAISYHRHNMDSTGLNQLNFFWGFIIYYYPGFTSHQKTGDHRNKPATRKVYWVVCQIHTNEMPLRHLIESLGKII